MKNSNDIQIGVIDPWSIGDIVVQQEFAPPLKVRLTARDEVGNWYGVALDGREATIITSWARKWWVKEAK